MSGTTVTQSRYLSGAHHIACVSSTLAVAACSYRMTSLSLAEVYYSSSVVNSIGLAYNPGDVVVIGTNAFSVGDDQYVHKFTTSPLAETASFSVQSGSLRWICTDGIHVICKGDRGRFYTLSSGLVPLGLHPSGLVRIENACCDTSGNLYLFDGMGDGAYFIVNSSTGVPTFVQFFKAANCTGIVSCFVDTTNAQLVIASNRVNRLITIDTPTLSINVTSVPAPLTQINGLFMGDPNHAICFATGSPSIYPDWATTSIDSGCLVPGSPSNVGRLAVSRKLGAVLYYDYGSTDVCFTCSTYSGNPVGTGATGTNGTVYNTTYNLGVTYSACSWTWHVPGGGGVKGISLQKSALGPPYIWTMLAIPALGGLPYITTYSDTNNTLCTTGLSGTVWVMPQTHSDANCTGTLTVTLP